MARLFRTEDAKRIISKYEAIKKEFSPLIDDTPNRLKQDISASANTVLNSQVVSNTIVDEINNGHLRIPDDLNTQGFVQALYSYASFVPILQRLKQLQSSFDLMTKESVSSLKGGASTFKWLFAGGHGRENANKAYQALSELDWISYEAEINIAKKALINIGHSTFAVAQDAINAYPYTYKDILSECANSALNTECSIGQIGAIIDKHRAILSDYSAAEYALEHRLSSYEAQVKDTALKLLSATLMEKLRETDVETIAQQRTGFRIKSLKDAGYTTLEDIYCATASNLASVRGISADTAYQIKDIVRGMADSMQKNLKIKLSVDHQTRQSTDLLKALYSYRYIDALIKSGKAEIAKPIQEATAEVQKLSELRNNLHWIVAPITERKEYAETYQLLSEKLYSDYPGKVRSFCREADEKITVTNAALWADFSRDNISYYNTLEAILPGILGNDDVLYGLPEDLAREIQDQTFFPQGLKVTLRRYQEWGVKYILHQEKALLGDEMGLGKTVQAIATMVSLRNTGATHFMVVCPASVLPNWCKEISKKSEFRPTKIHGGNRRSALEEWLRTGGVAVTTFETTNTMELPGNFQLDMLVVDEAHYIKNADARRSRSVRSISERANRLLFMTGTALENKVDEMISLIQVLRPDIAARIRNIAFMASAPEFRERVAPVYYRRKREDVLTELPEKSEIKEYCVLLPDEERAYENAVLRKSSTDVRRVSWTCDDLAQSSKARRMMEIISEAEQDGRKILVFSFYRETVRKVCEYLGERCTQPIHGGISVERRQEIIDEFETMPAGSVLVSQIQAGGTGLNIQAASVVIICEPQLKPSIENQAISRAYRMGQVHKVLVYRLLAENTIDERITDLLEQKQAVFDAFADKSAAAEATMHEESSIDDKTFGKLIQEEIDRINARRAS